MFIILIIQFNFSLTVCRTSEGRPQGGAVHPRPAQPLLFHMRADESGHLQPLDSASLVDSNRNEEDGSEQVDEALVDDEHVGQLATGSPIGQEEDDDREVPDDSHRSDRAVDDGRVCNSIHRK